MFKYKLPHIYAILDKLQSYFSNGIRNANILQAWSCHKYDIYRCTCNL